MSCLGSRYSSRPLPGKCRFAFKLLRIKLEAPWAERGQSIYDTSYQPGKLRFGVLVFGLRRQATAKAAAEEAAAASRKKKEAEDAAAKTKAAAKAKAAADEVCLCSRSSNLSHFICLSCDKNLNRIE